MKAFQLVVQAFFFGFFCNMSLCTITGVCRIFCCACVSSLLCIRRGAEVSVRSSFLSPPLFYCEQAYWNVATKRLVDNVCMTMEQDFVVKLLGKVESELFLLTNRYTDVEELFVEVITSTLILIPI